jgi:hypothetical protein
VTAHVPLHPLWCGQLDCPRSGHRSKSVFWRCEHAGLTVELALLQNQAGHVRIVALGHLAGDTDNQLGFTVDPVDAWELLDAVSGLLDRLLRERPDGLINPGFSGPGR